MKRSRPKKIKRTAIICRTFSSFSEPDYPFDDPSDIKAIKETLRIQDPKNLSLGRISLLTPLTEHIILKAIKLGLSVERASNLAGVSIDAFYRWKKCASEAMLDREEEGPNMKYVRFMEKFKRAAIHGELEKLKLVNEAAIGGVPVQEVKTTVKVHPKTGKEIVLSKETKMKTTLPNWQAAMTLLERRYPERWGRTATVDEEDAQAIANKIKDEVNRVFESVPPKKGNK